MLVCIVVGFNSEVVMLVCISYLCFSQSKASADIEVCTCRRHCRAAYIAGRILNAPWPLQALGRFSLSASVKSCALGLCMTPSP